MIGKTWTGSCVADAVALRHEPALPPITAWTLAEWEWEREREDVLPVVGTPQQVPAQRGMYYWLRKKLVG